MSRKPMPGTKAGGPALGEEFLSCVDACIESIRRTPESLPRRPRELSPGVGAPFPYVIFCEFIERTVTVYCVLHTSRDPDKWRQRLT